jgi:hypothetical protein
MSAALALVAAVALAAGCVSSDVSREIGARCDDSDQCDDRCLSGGQYPDGLCTVTCDDGDDCPGGSACADLEGGVCLYACDDDAACEFLGDGWRCRVEVEHGAAVDQEVTVCVGPP